MNNQALLIWQEIFGSDLLPNDCEIIGVEQDGSLIYYDAQKAECYINGINLSDHDERLNEREHIVTHPLAYVALLRNALGACVGVTKAKVKAIAERSLSADPHRYVNDLSLLGRNVQLKAAVKVQQEFFPKNGVSASEHDMMTREPHLRGKDGKFVTPAEFARRCHVLSALRTSSIDGETVRKHAILFGRGDDHRWKYMVKLYCKGGKKEALRRAAILIQLCAMGQNMETIMVDFTFSHFQANYNQKIPLSF